MLQVFSFLVLFCATFSGDYKIEGIDVFYFFWLGALVLRAREITSREVLLQFVLFLLFIPYFSRFGIAADADYYQSFLKTILFINVLPITQKIVSEKSRGDRSRKVIIFILVSFCLLSVFSRYLSVANGVYDSINPFGRNIVYRILGFAFIFVLLQQKSSKENSLNRGGSSYLYVVLFGLAMISTGSRGALILFVLVTVVYSLLVFRFSWKAAFINLTAVSLLIVVFFYLRSVYWRTFYFGDIERGSIATRVDMQKNVLSWFDWGKIDSYFRLSSTSSIMIVYSHNLFF